MTSNDSTLARTLRRARATFTGLAAATTAVVFGSLTASAQSFEFDREVIIGEPEVQTHETWIAEIQGGGTMFLDAHETWARDYNVVLRQYQGNSSQRWLVTELGGGIVTLMQMNTGRYLDAHEIAELDFRVVTRPLQTFDQTQLWRIYQWGGGFVTIQHVNTGLFLEPYLDASRDFQVVLRPERMGDNLQLWRM